MEETQGEDIRKHHTVNTVVFYSRAQLLLFSASPAQDGDDMIHSLAVSFPSCSFIRGLGGGQVTDREEDSSAATLVTLDRGLIFGICTSRQAKGERML